MFYLWSIVEGLSIEPGKYRSTWFPITATIKEQHSFFADYMFKDAPVCISVNNILQRAWLLMTEIIVFRD